MAAPPRAADVVLRLLLAGVLLFASADKILHPQDFALLVKGYHILPDALINPVAIWLPWLELGLGLCLVSGFWCEGAAVLTAGLFGVFWLLLIVSYFRGIDVNCGCFSSRPDPAGTEPTPMLFYIGRDAVLLGLALMTAWVRLRVAKERGA
ncbi:MAG: hypothetical protein C0405_13130 [Desulfovibrio sp.]|nr:hypothetical protein [Desulfovibrio sp.]